jgi:NADPH:quinone reductase-like Zn-dependent oxidoreductase
MKAIVLKDFGSPDHLQPANVPLPVIDPDEVLVLVRSVSINPVDTKIRQGVKLVGRAPDPLPLILGWDLSGIVTAIGDEVTEFKTGDEVFGMINYPGLGNAYAEFVAVKGDQLAIKPVGVSYADAAAATLSALTAWQALTVNEQIKKDATVLIHAASGGVGHFAVQMAKHLGGYVFGTSSAANRDFVLSLGADEHIDYKVQPPEQVLNKLDYILDPLGGKNTEAALDMVKDGGTVVSIVFGFTPELLDKAKKRNVNAYNIQVKPNGTQMKIIADLLRNGHITSHVTQNFSIDEMPAAHRLLESGRSTGKIVLSF